MKIKNNKPYNYDLLFVMFHRVIVKLFTVLLPKQELIKVSEFYQKAFKKWQKSNGFEFAMQYNKALSNYLTSIVIKGEKVGPKIKVGTISGSNPWPRSLRPLQKFYYEGDLRLVRSIYLRTIIRSYNILKVGHCVDLLPIVEPFKGTAVIGDPGYVSQINNAFKSALPIFKTISQNTLGNRFEDWFISSKAGPNSSPSWLGFVLDRISLEREPSLLMSLRNLNSYYHGNTKGCPSDVGFYLQPLYKLGNLWLHLATAIMLSLKSSSDRDIALDHIWYKDHGSPTKYRRILKDIIDFDVGNIGSKSVRFLNNIILESPEVYSSDQSDQFEPNYKNTKDKELLKSKSLWESVQAFIDGDFNPVSTRLHLLFEDGGKVRKIVIGDIYSQSLLKPIHDCIFDILRTLETDGTFDQDAQSSRVQSWTQQGKHLTSYDLSDCTERFPASFQKYVLSNVFGDYVSDLWYLIMTDRNIFISSKILLQSGMFKDKTKFWKLAKGYIGREYVKYNNTQEKGSTFPKGINKKYIIKDNKIRYGVGQPMGLLSSWPAMALSHHVIVWMSVTRSGLDPFSFKDYAILGDDIVIANPLVASHYYDIITRELGIKISLPKSLIGYGCAEFAKRQLYWGTNISPLPSGIIMSMVKQPFLVITLRDIIEKYYPILRLFIHDGVFYGLFDTQTFDLYSNVNINYGKVDKKTGNPLKAKYMIVKVQGPVTFKLYQKNQKQKNIRKWIASLLTCPLWTTNYLYQSFWLISPLMLGLWVKSNRLKPHFKETLDKIHISASELRFPISVFWEGKGDIWNTFPWNELGSWYRGPHSKRMREMTQPLFYTERYKEELKYIIIGPDEDNSFVIHNMCSYDYDCYNPGSVWNTVQCSLAEFHDERLKVHHKKSRKWLPSSVDSSKWSYRSNEELWEDFHKNRHNPGHPSNVLDVSVASRILKSFIKENKHIRKVSDGILKNLKHEKVYHPLMKILHKYIYTE